MTPPPEPAPRPGPSRSLAARLAWAAIGFVFVGIGFVGVVVPGLPTTGFMILAAGAFAKSSPRLEAWVLSLPKIGPAVQSYRNGEGMPKKAKVWAIGMMTTAVVISAIRIDSWLVRIVLIVAWCIGTPVIARIPTRRPIAAPAAER